jgi:hypothetical protein
MRFKKALRIFAAALVCTCLAIPVSATETLKVLGQLNPAATTLSTLYTVPASTSTVVSTIVIANQVGTTGTFRVSIQPACATVDPKHYIAYDTAVPANDSIILTIGVTLATTDCIRVYASSTSLSFNAFGSEVQ